MQLESAQVSTKWE